mmetsp:Transcript_44399/g.127117  ORF Transcript_44399/g.127117 Transcript_44399/m.127117 type:complete len:341 (-) Transcript_44399:267-1289(-)
MGAFAVSINRDKSSAMVLLSVKTLRISVMSCPTPTTPTTLPSASRRVVAFSRISIRCPVFVIRGNSKLVVSDPRHAFIRTVWTSSRYSWATNSSTMIFPVDSSLGYPVKSAAFLFHSDTRPSKVTPKMGALAVSIRRYKSSAIVLLSSSALRMFVISCPTPSTPVTVPFASRRGVAFSRMSLRFPSLAIRGNSKFAVSSPWHAEIRTCWTRSRNSGVMKSSTRSLPIVSSLGNIDKSAAFLFHSVTRPSTFTPNIGAFAVSIRRDRSSATILLSVKAFLIAVISWPTPTTPVTFPLVSRRVVAFNRMSTVWPSLVNKGNSKFAVSDPPIAAVRTACTRSR